MSYALVHIPGDRIYAKSFQSTSATALSISAISAVRSVISCVSFAIDALSSSISA